MKRWICLLGLLAGIASLCGCASLDEPGEDGVYREIPAYGTDAVE